MQDIGKRIAELTRKYLQNRLSVAEKKELEAWLDASETNRRRFKDMTNEDRLAVGLALYQDAESEKKASRARIVWEPEAAAIKPETKLLRVLTWKWRRFAAAAVIILAVAGGYLVFRSPHSASKGMPPAITPERYQNDVPPGHNGAVLTLSNGQTIILDSVDNGELAREGNMEIVKEKGEIAYKGKNGEMFYNTISTARGRQWKVDLPDGSKVWLNAASSISFPLALNKERKVEIRGEAYFEVKHNAKLPFTVKVNDMLVEDIGTRFNINAYEEEKVIKTTLLEGAVKVLLPKDKAAVLVVNPGEQAECNPFSHDIQVVSDIETEDVVAWKNGLFQFKDASIESIMSQVARWYDADIVYTKSVMHRFNGEIPRNVPLSTLLKILESTRRVHFKIEGKTITVMP